MAKGEAKTTNTAIDAARAQNTQFQSNYQKQQTDQGNDAYNRNLTERNTLTTGYGNLASGGMTPEQEAKIRAAYSSGGGGGGYSTPAYTYGANIGGVQDYYNKLMGGGGVNRYALGTLQDLSGASGGISTENMGNIQGGITGFKGIGETGGYDKATLDRLQGQVTGIGGLKNLDPAMMSRFNEGLTGYSEFANTGGWSDANKANYMNRATSVIPSFYGQMNNQVQQANRVQGGYNPGLASSMRNSGRDQATAAQAASREAQLGLQSSINEGRLAGMGGLSSNSLAGANAMNDAAFRAQTEELNQGRGLQQDIVGNRLQGLTGQTQSAQALANSITDARLGASQGLNQIMNTDLQAAMGGAAGLNQVIGNRAQESAQQAAASGAASNASTANNLAMERWLYDTQNENKVTGLGGLGKVYTSAPAELDMYNQNLLQNQSITGGQINQNLGLRAQYNPNVSAWDRAMQGLNVGTGVAGAIMGGLGGFGSSTPSTGTQYTGGFTGVPNSGNWYGPTGTAYGTNGQWGGNDFTGWGGG